MTIIIPFKRYDNFTFTIELPYGFPTEIDASRDRKELYVIGKSSAASSLFIFDFYGRKMYDQIDTKSLALSTD